MHRNTIVIALAIAAACGGPKGVAVPAGHPHPSLDFGSRGHLEGWTVDGSTNGQVRLADAGTSRLVEVSSNGTGDIKLVRTLDATSLRARRARITVSATSDNGEVRPALRLSVLRPGGAPSPWDTSDNSPTATPGTLVSTIDIPRDAAELRVELVVSGKGLARFSVPELDLRDDIAIEKRILTKDEIERLRALAQLIGYLRYFHPSDQSARMDWIAYEVEATRRMLAAHDRAAATEVLSWLTKAAAPTAAVYEGSPPSVELPPPQPGWWLTRWRRFGLGSQSPFFTLRDGMSEPEDTSLGLFKTMHDGLTGCKHAVVQAHVHKSGAPLKSSLYVGVMTDEAPLTRMESFEGDGQLEMDVPSTTSALAFGIQFTGLGASMVDSVVLRCDGHPMAVIGPGENLTPMGTAWHLYSVDNQAKCDRGPCISVSRVFGTHVDPRNDIADVELGLGLRLRLPLVAWTDGRQTYPVGMPPILDTSWTSGDTSARVATVLDTWVTLRWFYPYFRDLGIDWDDVFSPSVSGAALATSGPEFLEVMQHLVASLRDDHARVVDDAYLNGVLPLLFHRFGDDLYFVTGIGAYKDALPVGSKVTTVDGVPTAVALERATATVSAATEGWRNYESALAIGYGPRGHVVGVKAVAPDGTVHEIEVPRLDLQENIDKVRENHPGSGTELAPGVLYVDLDSMDDAELASLLPKMRLAKAVIFDLRGYMTNAAFDMLGHFADREMSSAGMDTPVLDISHVEYSRDQWLIEPVAPHIAARALFLVDGRSASAPETLLQFVRNYHVGLVIGEQTGGTNGNVNLFETVGGLKIRFTGMRVLNQDGSQLQGRGITPDLVVHPTPQGIVAGKDEILDAALGAAAKP